MADKKRVGIPGILEVDRDAGVILFHVDPRYVLCRSPIVLTVSGLPTPVPDPTTTALDITHLVGQNWEAAPVASVPVPASLRDLAQELGHELETISSTRTLSPPVVSPPGAYAGVLYPEEVLGVMQRVLSGQWDGPNPEPVVDSLLDAWMRRHIRSTGDQASYLAQLVDAVKVRGCGDIVLARLNVALTAPPDDGDTVVIKRDRKFRLPGEGVEPDHPLSAMPMLGLSAYEDKEADDLYQDSFGVAESFYASEQVIHRRLPAPALPVQVREALWQRLVALGKSGVMPVLPDAVAAFDRLEGMLHRRDLEQNVLARLCYLAVFNVLRMVDGRVLLDRLWPVFKSIPPSGEICSPSTPSIGEVDISALPEQALPARPSISPPADGSSRQDPYTPT